MAEEGGYVLKECISSGMKGTKFCDEDDFDDCLDLASNSYYRFVLQREIINQPFQFAYFNGSGLVKGEFLSDLLDNRLLIRIFGYIIYSCCMV